MLLLDTRSLAILKWRTPLGRVRIDLCKQDTSNFQSFYCRYDDAYDGTKKKVEIDYNMQSQVQGRKKYSPISGFDFDVFGHPVPKIS